MLTAKESELQQVKDQQSVVDPLQMKKQARKTANLEEAQPEEAMPQDISRGQLAARTRARLSKYGVIQMRVLDLYQLKRVHIPASILKDNRRFKCSEAQVGEFCEDLDIENNPMEEGLICFDEYPN